MRKFRILAIISAFLVLSPLATFASGSGKSYDGGNYYDGYYEDSSRYDDRNDQHGYYYGSNIPGPEVREDIYNTIPWFNPPYEPYQYKLHSFPNGDFYFSTPGNNYLPYISSGYQPRPFDYGNFARDYYR